MAFIRLLHGTAAGQSRIEDLRWIEESGTYLLKDSNGAIRIGVGMALLLGDQARRGEYLSEGVESPATEAILYDIDNEVAVYFEYYPTGYIRDEDWKAIDADAMMRGFIESAETANMEHAGRDRQQLRITGWVTKPYYDKRRNSISMSIALEAGHDKIVNSSVLKLGRYGYERITWVGTADQYGWSDRLLETVVQNHSFDPGHRYKDYRDGDSVADFSMVGLVSAVALSKSPRAGFAILKLLRKFWVLIVGALAALGLGGRRAFSGR